ncbi:MAG: glycerol-3-phosphate dehydrogenase [Elusimicrobia bacterium]|nr:MAG: glycerol-3-phosphate dehydrogenase [Elusimicrobiota bacterium]
MKKIKKAAVLGLGSWGTALASVVVHHADRVLIWGRDATTVRSINETKRNGHYLPEVPIDPRVGATLDLAEAVGDADVVIVALPTQALADALAPLKKILPASIPVVSTSKGICTKTHRFPTAIIQETLGRPSSDDLYVLSGPSFAEETANGVPTALVFANTSLERATEWAHLFFTPTTRAYPGVDIIGVEVAGAVKNVIALAAGATDGLALGTNARSALITRGLAEITRFGVALGADPMTFLGLAGVGDLVLTCTGGLSRNRRLGVMLAEGISMEEALERLGQVAEGVPTTRSVKAIANKLGIEMPITDQVHAVLFERKKPIDALTTLMTRPIHPEH